MHELSIAEAILDAVRVEAEKRPGEHVAKVAVRVGALSGGEPDALSSGFECLVQGTDLAPLGLVIEHVPRRQRCPACDLTLDVADAKIDTASPRSEVGSPKSQTSGPGSRIPSPESAEPQLETGNENFGRA